MPNTNASANSCRVMAAERRSATDEQRKNVALDLDADLQNAEHFVRALICVIEHPDSSANQNALSVIAYQLEDHIHRIVGYFDDEPARAGY